MEICQEAEKMKMKSVFNFGKGGVQETPRIVITNPKDYPKLPNTC